MGRVGRCFFRLKAEETLQRLLLIYPPMKCLQLAFGICLLLLAACHPGPVIDTGPGQSASVGGTIAGIVSTATNSPVSGRKVAAVNTETTARFEATTGANGGYTIKVPEGTYRLEIELRTGESVLKQPAETKVNKSDLDPRRDFVITLRPAAGQPL
jgi:hypothetical protein